MIVFENESLALIALNVESHYNSMKYYVTYYTSCIHIGVLVTRLDTLIIIKKKTSHNKVFFYTQILEELIYRILNMKTFNCEHSSKYKKQICIYI